MHVNSQESKHKHKEKSLGKQETQGEGPWRKGSIEEVDARVETKKELRNASRFRKARAPPGVTLARGH